MKVKKKGFLEPIKRMGKTMIGTERPKIRKLLDSIYESRRLEKISSELQTYKSKKKYDRRIKTAQDLLKKRRIELGRTEKFDRVKPW